MRKAGASAATLLLMLALGAPGCKPSSLTPFGIGTRDYSTEGGNVNGVWEGKTASGGDVSFQVGNNAASSMRFNHVEGTCTLLFEALSTSKRITDDQFTIEIQRTQGRFVATVTFTTATTASGTYFFEALQAGDCPSAGTGTLAAEKQP